MLALPRIAGEEFGFRGVCVPANLLAGADERLLLRLRESGDKAGCPCLSLIETQPLALACRSEVDAAPAADRLDRVVRAAHALGCSAAIVGLAPPQDDIDDEALVERVAPRLRAAVERAERVEINFLITPTLGAFARSSVLTATLKKVGGFRIGSAPDFEVAGAVEDSHEFLRELTPHASSVLAASRAFTRSGRHKEYDFEGFLRTLRSLGYDGPIIIDYRGEGDARKGVAQTLAIIDAIEAEDAA